MHALIKAGLVAGAGYLAYKGYKRSSVRRVDRIGVAEKARWEGEGGALPNTATMPRAASEKSDRPSATPSRQIGERMGGG